MGFPIKLEFSSEGRIAMKMATRTAVDLKKQSIPSSETLADIWNRNVLEMTTALTQPDVAHKVSGFWNKSVSKYRTCEGPSKEILLRRSCR